jgi:hypothetical protein
VDEAAGPQGGNDLHIRKIDGNEERLAGIQRPVGPGAFAGPGRGKTGGLGRGDEADQQPQARPPTCQIWNVMAPAPRQVMG